MPRKRDPNKFRRGKEQRYNRIAAVSSRHISHTRAHLPLMPFFLIIVCVGLLMLTTMFGSTWVRNIQSLGSIQWSLPQIHFQNPLAHLPQISDITLPSFDIGSFFSQVGQIIMIGVASVSRGFEAFGSLLIQGVIALSYWLEYLGGSTYSFSAAILGAISQSIWGALVFVVQTVSNAFVALITFLDPRPYVPAVLGGIQTLAVYTGIVLWNVVVFVNPIPMQQQIVTIEVQTIIVLANILIFTGQIIWYGLLTLAQWIYIGVTATLNFIWGVVVGIWNAITGFFNAIGAGITNTKNAANNQLAAFGAFFKPYLDFLSKSFSMSMRDLGAGMQEMQSVSSELMGIYQKNAGR